MYLAIEFDDVSRSVTQFKSYLHVDATRSGGNILAVVSRRFVRWEPWRCDWRWLPPTQRTPMPPLYLPTSVTSS
jgi:hypothetical protein